MKIKHVVQNDAMDKEFQRLAAKQSKEWSSYMSFFKHTESSRKIVGLGDDVIASMLVHLNSGINTYKLSEHTHLCLNVLSEIIDEQIIPEDHRGRIELMCQDYINWGIENGYVQEVVE